jgi:hypothetical protein
MKVNIFKKIKLFFIYRKLIMDNYKIIVQGDNNFRIDKAYRIYTILSIPEKDAKYGITVAEEYINEYLIKADYFFNKLNLTELIALYEITQINENNYLLVFGYSQLNTKKVLSNIITFIFGVLMSFLTYFMFF